MSTDKPESEQNPKPAPAHPPDEPEITQEESVPVDRRDTEGERLMDQLGRERRQKEAED
ncbi:hypothetical protein ACA040_001717 [Xenophilus aerolatus]